MAVAQRQQTQYYTVDEYFALEERAEYRSEFYKGGLARIASRRRHERPQ